MIGMGGKNLLLSKDDTKSECVIGMIMKKIGDVAETILKLNSRAFFFPILLC